MGVMIRLGIWQLDRLKQRIASNAIVSAQVNAPQLNLNQFIENNGNVSLLTNLQYRPVVALGTYDGSQAVVLKAQVWQSDTGQNFLGGHLLVPLRLSGSSRSILVDLGWIPQDAVDSGKLGQYIPSGEVTVQGAILLSQNHATLGLRTDPPANGTRLDAFSVANVSRIGAQIPYSLLPVLLQQEPSGAVKGPPYPQAVQVDLSNGPHLSYAIQWFSFSLVLLAGYLTYFKKKTS
jgi:surfeit locus 1 family protein